MFYQYNFEDFYSIMSGLLENRDSDCFIQDQARSRKGNNYFLNSPIFELYGKKSEKNPKPHIYTVCRKTIKNTTSTLLINMKFTFEYHHS